MLDDEVERTVKSIWERHQQQLSNHHKDEPDISAMIEDVENYEEVCKALSKIRFAGDREKYFESIKKKYKVTKDAIRKDIEFCLKQIPQKEVPQEEKKEISDKEKEEALAILNVDGFWDKFLETTETLGYVGENENKITLYLCMTSRKLDDPISATVKGESSAGKSFAVQETSRFIS